MSTKPQMSVLIVDDEPYVCECLADAFAEAADDPRCPYAFAARAVRSLDEAVASLRDGRWDVVVLDVRLGPNDEGIRIATTMGLDTNSSGERPVVIVLTGHAEYGAAVKAIRSGVWDYIPKYDDRSDPTDLVFNGVVDSATNRLRQKDLQRDLQDTIGGSWFPEHVTELRAVHGDRLVAIWHKPTPAVVAAGRDVFELADNLKEWRSEHAWWEQPFIVRLASTTDPAN